MQRSSFASSHDCLVAKQILSQASDSTKGNVSHNGYTIILANTVFELSAVQKSGYLRENVFVLEHCSYLLDCKVAKLSPFHFKKRIIDYISINSNNYLFTFTGQY